MLEIEKVKEKIQLLNEAEAKSLLLIIYARLDVVINGSRKEASQRIIQDLFNI